MQSRKERKQDVFTKCATCFGIGYLSPLPGTLGSILAFVFLPLIIFFPLSIAYVILISSFLFLIGIWSCDKYETTYSLKDPKEVIIDELVAQLILFICISYVFRSSFELSIMLLLCVTSFVLFRFFDIVKPWPISFVQKNIHGGFGVMLDDLLAAFATFIMISIIAYVLF
ncbi:phosphatidylglycerophosphatase A family protein [Neorickettsia sennetsu]|uniref:Phosphatidylglycerophosphatase A n=1 Tax=Ehrlichia sennetsu (strain ATCC VR-367 / Miyayama) TaxID=222891 RepID=Q2GEB3_EHRS3|nr:phosphatidylglycerophosphatase A [Neorickettsia sennetsu]ABD46516.1 phosphatidylglycerophosphatase A [Neorickettsia sennetsu str. Miyayama]